MIQSNDVNFEKFLDDNFDSEKDYLQNAGYWTDKVVQIAKDGHNVTGDKLPWAKSHEYFRFREKEVTIWAGYNSHRKSLAMGMCLLWLAQEHKVCIASFEMPPEQTLYRMCKQAIGHNPNRFEITRFMEWADENIILYDIEDVIQPQRCLGMAFYAAKELGCKHVAIDNMMKTDIKYDDYNKQGWFLNKLTWIAKETQSHQHLVIHVTKGDENIIPNRYNIFGASQLSNIPDNVIICWKDALREEAVLAEERDSLNLSEEHSKALTHSFDQKIVIDKQRIGRPATFNLYFDPQSFQFTQERGSIMDFDHVN